MHLYNRDDYLEPIALRPGMTKSDNSNFLSSPSPKKLIQTKRKNGKDVL